jgi:hypothetical protein
MDEQEHVQPLEEHRVHTEEVGRRQRRGMGSEELLPGQLGSSASGWNVGATQDRTDGGRGDRVAELQQLASNPEVAPPRVLPRHPDAGGLVTLAEREEALGQVWHIPSAETISARRFIEMFFQQVGTAVSLQAPPKLAITLLAIFSPFMRAAKETLYQSEHPFVVDHSKYARTFGRSTTPHHEAIAETIKWFRQHSPTSR